MTLAPEPAPALVSIATLSDAALRSLFRDRLAKVTAELAGALDTRFTQNPFRPLRRRLIIGHPPRVGSHLLCEGLLRFGAAIEEVFEEPRILNVSAKREFASVQDYCEWVIRRHAPRGAFGVSGGVKVFAPLEMAREAPQFAKEWPIIFITRQDIIAEGVSEVIALATRAYKSSTRPLKTLTEDDYDASAIARSIDASLAVIAAWEGAFLHYEVAPLRLTYEALIADVEGVCAKAAAFAGLADPPITQKWLRSEPLERQSNALNAAWIDRFRSENPTFCVTREAGFFALAPS